MTKIKRKLKKEKTVECKNIITLFFLSKDSTQPAITCSKLTIETLEQDVKYVQS